MKPKLRKQNGTFIPLDKGEVTRDGIITAIPDPEAERRAEAMGEPAEPQHRFELSFSSESPYTRWFGEEILGHKKGEVRLDWLRGGTAPLLLNHDTDKQIGVIENAEIKDGRGTAVVRFGKSALAQEIRQDVLDGIRSNISVGYRIKKMILEEESEDGRDVYRVTDWEPLENSIVAVPADKTVGVGRSDEPTEHIERIDNPMDNDKPTAPPVDLKAEHKKAAEAERKRGIEITDLCKAHDEHDLAAQAIAEGWDIAKTQKALLDRLANREKPSAKVGRCPDESRQIAKRFSIRNAILSQMPGSGVKAEFEQECSDEVAKKFGKKPEGIYIPADVMMQARDLDIANTTGSYVVSTDLKSGSFIDLLRNRLVTEKLGVPTLTGLVGDIAIPKLSAAGTAYWVTEAEAITESVQTLAQVTGTPKTVAGLTDVSRKLLKQSSIDVEALILDDLAKILAQAIDVAFLAGTGSNGQPTGVQSSATDVTVTAGTPTRSQMLGFIEQLESENALSDSVKWAMTPEVMVKLADTVQHATAGTGFILSLENRHCLGYPYVVSNNVPANDALFGDWSQAILAMWGTVDLQVNPYFHSTTGSVRVRAMQDVDVMVRQAGAFATADVTT